jgi:hypothetical protein
MLLSNVIDAELADPSIIFKKNACPVFIISLIPGVDPVKLMVYNY